MTESNKPETENGTFSVVTFGCKVNQYETQALREDLLRRGYREVSPDESPSLQILNTCTVTEVAGQEALRLARTIRRDRPDARLLVTGCAAETDRVRFREFGEVLSQKDKARLGEIADHESRATDHGSEFPLHRRQNSSVFGLSVSRFDGHTRAFLKIEDGCDLNCSFCIIPRVRGTVTSRPVDPVVEEARRLLDHGHREIVLTGVHLGSYGKDLAKRSLLPDLMERLLDLPSLGRIRLSSIEANEVDAPLLRLMAAEPKRVCPHLHIPLQSGDDEILRAMRRRYSVRQFLATCDRVKEAVPDPGLTTDVIPGFPGETEEQFENTVDLCRRVGFSRIHIFPYSPRRGTDAATLPDNVPGRTKKARLRRLKTVAAELTKSYYEKFVGRPVDLLVEEKDGTGYTERYIRARLPGALPGSLTTAYGLRSTDSLLELSP